MGAVKLFFNPFQVVIDSYNALYSNPCEVMFVAGLHQGEDAPWGCTEFGSEGAPVVSIDVECPISGAVEVLAHELAHVAVGSECSEDHGPEWEAAFSAIHEGYLKIVTDLGGEMEQAA